MPACRARSRNERAARPSRCTMSQAAATIASRADWRRASRQVTADAFDIVQYSCTALKLAQRQTASRFDRGFIRWSWLLARRVAVGQEREPFAGMRWRDPRPLPELHVRIGDASHRQGAAGHEQPRGIPSVGHPRDLARHRLPPAPLGGMPARRAMSWSAPPGWDRSTHPGDTMAEPRRVI